jgi:four helix bundle protein
MVSAQSYRDLVVWQKAIDLVVGVYRVTRCWPEEELFGLTDQVRRAAVSIPANIAEGQGRDSGKEFLHHLSIADDSLHEVETHLVISQRLNYLDEPTCAPLLHQAAEVDRLLHGLKRSLRSAMQDHSGTQEPRN